MTDCMDARQREITLQTLENNKFDLIVIGGGITGAGILREAALRGLSVALLEANDFASGTSSKSTKLIHGGIRYLAMGHFHVVRQAARERKRVHRLAPHLAEPKELMLPARNVWEHLKYRIGVSLYEYLGRVDSQDRHFNLGGTSLEEEEPSLDASAFPFATIYREYLTEDARLVLANIRAGVDAGGIAGNYLRVTDLVKKDGRSSGVHALCELTGREMMISATGVINAAGPWVESISAQNGIASPKNIVLSKGIHIVVAKEHLPVNHPILMVTDDNRPVFAIPRNDVVYIGTTDTPYNKDANHWPEVEQADIEYLFEPVKRYFGVQLTMSDCRATWAGLRPLIAEPGKSTKDISRKDEIWISDSGLITIAGGKLTGYRKMAEDTVNRAVQSLALKAAPSVEDFPLPGGDFGSGLDALSEMIVTRTGLDEATVRRLVRLYGAESEAVIAHGDASLIDGGLVLTGEILWAIYKEGANTLVDALYRRTRAAVYYPEEVLGIIEPAGEIMAAELGWDEARRSHEVKQMRTRFRVDSEFD